MDDKKNYKIKENRQGGFDIVTLWTDGETEYTTHKADTRRDAEAWIKERKGTVKI